MANNKKSTPRYDLKAQDRKRNLAIQLGLTAIVVIFAVALVLYIVMGHDKKTGSGRRASRPDHVEHADQEGRQRRAQGRSVDLRGLPVPALP